MKRIITMKTIRKIGFGLAVLAFGIAALTCEQPFKAGLGPVVDTRNPSVVLDSPSAGSYLSGERLFTGHAEDDYKLASVWLRVTNYSDADKYPLVDYQRVALDSKGVWTYPIDTTQFDDGDFMIRLMARDSANKKAETDEIAFFIKNNPPEIKMALPLISQTDPARPSEPGETGGLHLNFGATRALPENLSEFTRVMDTNADMVGTLYDSKGINLDKGTDPVTGKDIFPPQYRFWRINNMQDSSDQEGYLPGYLPSLEEEPWTDFILDEELEQMGLNDYLFSYTLPDKPSCFFGFEIRAQSSDDNYTEFRYPRDCWPGVDWGGYGESADDFITENRYVMLYLRSPKAYPVIELYKLENIYGEIINADAWNGAEEKYDDIPGLDNNTYYPYVDKLTVSKHGPFTLRIKAQHSDGVRSAEVYWEKDDKSERGRFIWDPADTDLYPGWDVNSNVSGDRPYSEWGRRDLHGNADAPLTTRSFVFTYNGARENIPAGYNAQVAGHSKIQRFLPAGAGTAWDNEKTKLDNKWPLNPVFDTALWEDMDTLSEGIYNIEVWAVSDSGTPIPVPFTCTVSIDMEPPEVDVNSIDGGAVDQNSADPENPAYIVNGVVRPRLRFSDSRPEDTGFRTGTLDYFKMDTPAGQPVRHSSEQVFILVGDSDRGAMDANISSRPRWWPALPESSGDPLVINDVLPLTALKHGPVVNSQCLFKTSPVYSDADTLLYHYEDALAAETDALRDGNYWLYVFARDNAFNVGYKRIPLTVNFKSDFPIFDYSVGTINDSVKDPNVGADGMVNGVEEGFLAEDGALRNKFGANSAIRVRLRDDDGLYLGVTGAGTNTGVEISFIGSYTDSSDNIVAYDSSDSDYNMRLTSSQVRAIFAPAASADAAVKERQGYISQSVLLGLMKQKDNYLPMFGDPGDSVSVLEEKREAASSLPDGLYRVTISIRDNNNKAVKLVTGDLEAESITQTSVFWIAVDTVRPRVTDQHPEANSVPVAGIYISADEDIDLIATVSDQNGPVTLVNGLKVTDIDGNDVPNVLRHPLTNNDIVRNTAVNDRWEGRLSVPINMGGRSGVFTFEARVKDRFGNESLVTWKYSVDQEPPVVSLPAPIFTFDRVQDDVILAGVQVSSPNDNKERLTNQAVKFTINAVDNFKVEGLRWWLLPADKSSIGPDPFQPEGPGNIGALANSASGTFGQVLDFNAFPALSPDKGDDVLFAGTGKYGEINLENRPYDVFVDTATLADGEYRLHIIATDAAGNFSRVSEDVDKRPTSNLYQSVFVLQEEDRPYFGRLSPDNAYDGDGKVAYVYDEYGSRISPAVVGWSGLRVMGTIFDDDGFDNGVSPRTLLPDSVEIWFSDDENATDVLDADGVPTDTSYKGPITVQTADLSRQGKNINLSIDLTNAHYNGTFLISESAGDGLKHYVVKATDSFLNKQRMPGDPPAGPAGAPTAFDTAMRASRSRHYSFVYDTVAPEIALTYPVTGGTFGLNAGTDFWLEGWMKDTNLGKTENGNYYFKYRLDDQLDEIVWELDSASILWEPGDPGTCPGDDTNAVYFKVSAANVVGNMLNFGGVDSEGTVTGLSEGSHTLVIVAEDLSGKTFPYMLSFIKDVTPPSFEFTSPFTAKFDIPENIADPDIGYWWRTDVAPGDVQTWYKNKHTWISELAFPVPTVPPTEPKVIPSIYREPTGDAVLSGTFTDTVSDIDDASFRYWIDGSASAVSYPHASITLDGQGKNIRWSVNLGSIADGIHTIRLEVADKSGITMPMTGMYAFRVDSADPRVSISNTTPAVFGNTGGFTSLVFAVTGEAIDANLKEVSLRIYEAGERAPATNYLDVTLGFASTGDYQPPQWYFLEADPDHGGALIAERLVWGYNITTGDVYPTLSDGKSYDVVAVATDWNDAPSEEAVWTFTVDKSPPEFDFAGGLKPESADINPSEDNNRLVIDSNVNVLSSQNLKIYGTVNDDASAITALQGRVEQWNYGTGAWDIITVSGRTDALGWFNLVSTGNTSAEVNWTMDFSEDYNASTSPSAIKVLDEGLYRIRVQARDDSWIANPASPDPIAASGLFNSGGLGNPAPSDFVYFFYDRSGPTGIDLGELENFYSSRKESGTLEFSGNVKDPNRFRSVTLSVLTSAGTPVLDADNKPVQDIWPKTGDLYTMDETEGWEVSISLPYEGTGAVPDGAYRLEIKATDLAGKTTTVRRNFTLDNTPPETVSPSTNRLPLNYVTEPGLRPAATAVAGYPNASVTVLGGADSVITGTTGDTSSNRSESGVKAVWYHLGFLDGRTDWPANFETLLAQSVIGTGNTDSGKYDDLFDTEASAAGNAWFKLAEGGMVPTGFVVNGSYDPGTITTAPNVYDWRFEIPNIKPGTDGSLPEHVVGGLKQYTLPITVKGRSYNDSASNRWMAVPVLDGPIGTYRMPLWVRVADNAGNVSYFCRDIWIYPDGDIPTTSIISPADAGMDVPPRGGTVSADGIATNNTAVYSVIYRVRADNYREVNGTDFGYLSSEGGNYYYEDSGVVDYGNDDNIVTLTSSSTLQPGTDYELSILDGFDYSTAGWYFANLEAPKGEPNIPWNFNFNVNEEVTNRIAADGFDSTGGTNNDTIRVWLEVFVFNGSLVPNRISIADGTADEPKPFVRVFYLKRSSPKITPLQVGYGTSWENYTGQGSISPQSRMFTITATLDAADGSLLRQISVRRPDEVSGSTGYRTAWQTTDGIGDYVSEDGRKLVPGLTLTPGSPAGQIYTLNYTFNTTAQTVPTDDSYGTVRNGGWRDTGGTYRVEIRIRDNNTPSGEFSYTFVIGIDNFAPAADPNHTFNRQLSGSSQDIGGRAFDYFGPRLTPSPSERRVEKVLAWLTRNSSGEYINIDTGAEQASVSLGPAMNILLGRVADAPKAADNITVNEVNITSPGTLNTSGNENPNDNRYRPPTASGWVREISESTALPGTGMTWVPSNVWDITWAFNVNPFAMTDGNITMHYIVMDNAGNASYYEQYLVVRNTWPVINSVTLYTSNDTVPYVSSVANPNDVNSLEYRIPETRNTAGYEATDFISKNKYVGFKVDTVKGNDTLHYRLQYVQRESIQVTAANMRTLIASIYGSTPTYSDIVTIQTVSNAPWENLGAKSSALGTHFMLLEDSVSATDTWTSTGYIWVYRTVPALTRTVQLAKDTNGNNPPVLPNPASGSWPGNNFNFAGDTDFAVTGTGKITHRDTSETPADAANPPALFLIKVWDSVDNGDPGHPVATEYDQLWDAVVIGMDVRLIDRARPSVRLYDLNPYTETAVEGTNPVNGALDPRGLGQNIGRGGLYNTAPSEYDLVKSGHIEPRLGTTALANADGFVSGDTGTTFTYDQVSGKVILRGVATDNQLVEEIRIRVGTGTEQPILSLDKVSTSPTYGTLQPPSGVDARAAESMHWRNGHTVEWAYVWNTGTPANGVSVWVRVKDSVGSEDEGITTTGLFSVGTADDVNQVDLTGVGVTPANPDYVWREATTGTSHNAALVDIKPYVYGFEREMPKYATKRSIQGWYSFYQGEENIAVLGFNLSGAAVTLTLNDGSSPATLTTTLDSDSRPIFTIPNAANSGKLTVNRGGNPVLNYTTNDSQSWNKEYYQYTSGSELWVNKHYAHIWRSQQNDLPGVTPSSPITYFGNNTDWGGSSVMKNPAMTLVYTGNNSGSLFGAWISDLNRGVYTSLNDNAARENIENYSSVSLGNVDVGYYNSAGGSLNHSNIAYNYLQSANANIYMRDKDNIDDALLKKIIIVPGERHNISGNTSGTPTDRWKSVNTVRMEKSNLATFYDSYNRRLVYSMSYYDNESTRVNYVPTDPAPVLIDGNGVTGGTSTNAGLYNAVDYTSETPNKYAVIAYYDQANDIPKLAYASLTEATVEKYITFDERRTIKLPASLKVNSGNTDDIGYEFTTANFHNLSVGQDVLVNPSLDGNGKPIETTTNRYRVYDTGYWSQTGGGTYSLDSSGNGTVVRLVRVPDGQLLTTGTANSTRWYLIDDKYKTVSITTGAWTRRNLTAAAGYDADLFNNAGTHISMKVDTANNIHLAFFNSRENTLVYAKGTRTGAFQVEKVDAVVTGGTLTDISLDGSNNPFIVYADSSRIGSYDGARMAYKRSATAGDWEAVSMPANYMVSNDRLNIEAWPPANRSGGSLGTAPVGGWSAAIGYASDQFRIAYFFKPNPSIP